MIEDIKSLMDKLVVSVKSFEKALYDTNSTAEYIAETCQKEIDAYYDLYEAIKQYKEDK